MTTYVFTDPVNHPDEYVQSSGDTLEVAIIRAEPKDPLGILNSETVQVHEVQEGEGGSIPLSK